MKFKDPIKAQKYIKIYFSKGQLRELKIIDTFLILNTTSDDSHCHYRGNY